jgi:hypothetical protein
MFVGGMHTRAPITGRSLVSERTPVLRVCGSDGTSDDKSDGCRAWYKRGMAEFAAVMRSVSDSQFLIGFFGVIE